MLKKKKKIKIKTEKNKQIEYLEKLIEISLKNSTGSSEELNALFEGQANKLRLQLKNLKENNELPKK